MRTADHRAHAYENAVLDLAEALTLGSRVGRTFPGVVTEFDHRRSAGGTHGSIQIQDPAIEAPVSSQVDLPSGSR